jgi:hypothetical protein
LAQRDVLELDCLCLLPLRSTRFNR